MDIYKIINLLLLSFAQAAVITFFVYLFCINPQVVALERRMWAKFKKFLRRQLRKSKKIVAWAESSDDSNLNVFLSDAEIWKDVWFKA